jgi:hypothetical protein
MRITHYHPIAPDMVMHYRPITPDMVMHYRPIAPDMVMHREIANHIYIQTFGLQPRLGNREKYYRSNRVSVLQPSDHMFALDSRPFSVMHYDINCVDLLVLGINFTHLGCEQSGEVLLTVYTS